MHDAADNCECSVEQLERQSLETQTCCLAENAQCLQPLHSVGHPIFVSQRGLIPTRLPSYPADVYRRLTERRQGEFCEMSDLWRLSATQLATMVRRGEVSATEVSKSHLDRLDAVNPAINAVVQDCSDDALAAAAAIDARISAGEDPGPLAGVPVTTKVNVDQAGHPTTNGLRILNETNAHHDSPVVANLRRAGAVIVGRTNTPALSLRWFTKNDLHGQTLNPRNRSITPGGSSGGAAAAVASGICAVAHGTDIAGSIRYPAYACGLHGLRPSLGRIPAYNAPSADRFIGAQLMAVSGPIARSIEDISLTFKAMAAADPRDPWYVPAPFDSGPYQKRAALTLAPDGMPVDGRVRDALIRAARTLEDAG